MRVVISLGPWPRELIRDKIASTRWGSTSNPKRWAVPATVGSVPLGVGLEVAILGLQGFASMQRRLGQARDADDTHQVTNSRIAPSDSSKRVTRSNQVRSIRSTSSLPVMTPTGISTQAQMVERMSGRSKRPAKA